LLHGRAFVHSTSKQLRLTGGSDGNLIVWKVVEHLGSGHCKSMKRFGGFSSRVISSRDKTHSGHFLTKILTPLTRHPVELKSFSNPLRIQQVF